jgi:GT2 family glycosyltransferase/Tfp pilus assembly protein PilF
MPKNKIRISILLPDDYYLNNNINNTIEVNLLKNAFEELGEVESSEIFTCESTDRISMYNPDISLSLNCWSKKVFLKNGLSIFWLIDSKLKISDENLNSIIDELIAYNADIYITEQDEIKRNLGNIKPVEIISNITYSKDKININTDRTSYTLKDLNDFAKNILSFYDTYIDKYGRKPFLIENVIIDDFISRFDDRKMDKFHKFISDYNSITEKKNLLREQLSEAEKNHQRGNVLSILSELILLEHGNVDLLIKYSDILKELKLEEQYSIFNENILSDNREMDEVSELNVEVYKEIESLIAEAKFDEAKRLIYEKLEEFPSDQYFHFLQARMFYHKNDLLKSKVILEDILTTNPDFFLARNDLAIIYHECENDFKAIECLKYALKSNCYNYDILKNLGDLYCHCEMFEEALKVYRLIVQQFPEDVEVIKVLAALSIEAKLYNDAIIYLKHALKIKPDDIELNNTLLDIEKIQNINNNCIQIAAVESNSKVVSIIILTYNNLFYTRETIKSIKKYTNVPYEIIIVDNNSTDGTVEYLQNNPNLNVILNNYNKGFAAGCNQGISVAKGEYILLLNNDVIVTEGWLDRLLDYFKRDASLGIVGPITNYISGPQLDANFLKPGVSPESIINDGDLFIQKYAESLYEQKKGKGGYFPRITGFCMLISRKVIETIGGLDEQFAIGNYEDDDFCVRAQMAGFKGLIASDVFIYHFGSKSFSLLGDEKYKEIIKINKKKFIGKYGKSAEEIFLKKAKIDKEINLRCEYKKQALTKSSSGKKRLALCMIVKDEAKDLEKCMGSVIDLVDEVIVVDTGSTDNTKNIAEKYCAKVFPYKWNSDFSAARNFALEHTKSEWILVLDADEELSADSAAVLLNSIKSPVTDAFTVKIINILEDDSFSKYDIFPLTRLFRNKESFRYEGIIHEQIKLSILKECGIISDSEIQILHHGYRKVDKDKISRNSNLLYNALEKEPENQYYLYQLGSTLFAMADNEKSIEYLKKAYDLSIDRPGTLSEEIIEKLLIKISQYYLQRDDISESEKYNNILLLKKTDNPIVHYISAAIHFSNKNYRESLEVLLKLKDKLAENNEQGIDMHQIYIDLGNNYYILENYDEAFLAFQKALEINNSSFVACFNLGSLLFRVGHYDDAEKMLEWSLKLNPEFEKASALIDKIKNIRSREDGT